MDSLDKTSTLKRIMTTEKLKKSIIYIVMMVGIIAIWFWIANGIDNSLQGIYDSGFQEGLKACEFYQELLK